MILNTIYAAIAFYCVANAVPVAQAQQTTLNGTTTRSITEITSQRSSSASLTRVPTITSSPPAPGQPTSTDIITDSNTVVLSTMYSTIPFGNKTTGPSTVTTQPLRTSSNPSSTGNPNLQSGASGRLLDEKGILQIVLTPVAIVLGGMLVLR